MKIRCLKYVLIATLALGGPSAAANDHVPVPVVDTDPVNQTSVTPPEGATEIIECEQVTCFRDNDPQCRDRGCGPCDQVKNVCTRK